MAHSNRLRIHWLLVLIEILLFIAGIATAYFSETGEWGLFAWISFTTVLLYAIVKLFETWPVAKDLLAREDKAARMAASAERYGVVEYFNMQIPADQNARNNLTQAEIDRAQRLWLCANSGASFLDPAIYRHWHHIQRRLQAGVDFRVVLLDPFSDEKEFRNQLNVSGDDFDSKLNIANLVRLSNTYPSLQIRFVSRGMHATVFATENCLFFDPYHLGLVGERIENRTFCLAIEPSIMPDGVGLYQVFKSHFDTLWRSSKSFTAWHAENMKRLPAGLPELNERL